VLNILNKEGNIEGINHIFISLTPRAEHPNAPLDFRLISLFNVLIKIVTKTIATRIKTILPNIIKDNQSAFLSRRLISNNSLIVFETFHYLIKSKKKNNGYVGIKLDMAKAYDSLELNFIENTLIDMGFPIKLIKGIMKLYSVCYFLHSHK